MMNVIIVYHIEQSEEAALLNAFLDDLGVQVWLDGSSISPREQRTVERRDALARADLVIFICSHKTTKESFYEYETRARDESLQFSRYSHLRSIPIKIEECIIPESLNKFQYDNIFRDDWKYRIAKLLLLKCRQLVYYLPGHLIQFIMVHEESNEIVSEQAEYNEPFLDIYCDIIQFIVDTDYYKYVNAEIYSFVFGQIFNTRFGFTEANPSENIAYDCRRTSELHMRTELFFRSHELVSLRFLIFIYFPDSKHPNCYSHCLNFFGNKIGKRSLEQLLGGRPEAASFLRSYCKEALLQKVHEAGIEDPTFLFYPEEDDGTWATFREYSFDTTGVWINLDPGDVLPFAYGALEIRIPWRLVEKWVHPIIRRGPLAEILG